MEPWLEELRPYPGESPGASGWRLTKAGWRLVRRDPAVRRLTLLAIAFAASYMAIAFLAGIRVVVNPFAGHDWLLRLLAALPLQIGVVLLFAAIVAATDAAVDGLPMEVGEALSEAISHLGPLFRWAALWLAFLIVSALLFHDAALGLIFLVEIVWYALSLFVIPAILIDGEEAGGAFAESLRVARRNWRGVIAVIFGLGFVLTVATYAAAYPLFVHANVLRLTDSGDWKLIECLGIGLATGVAMATMATREAATTLIYRADLDDLPGREYARPRLGRGRRLLRATGAVAVALFLIGVVSAISDHDRRIVRLSQEAGSNYASLVPYPSGSGLHTGSPVFYSSRQIGEVLWTGEEGGQLKVAFHVEPGYSPSTSPGELRVVGVGEGSCLVIVPTGSVSPTEAQTY